METSPALQNLFSQYTHLPLGGKEVVCPYWINNLKRLKNGPGGGKGKPEEIVKYTEETARKKKVNLNKLNEKQTQDFMKINHIGIDCSGLAFWLLNALDMEKGGNGIDDDIPNSRGRFLKARASVKMLTADEVSRAVLSIDGIKPGDMIRLRRGRHLLVVMTVKKNTDQKHQEILYVHSSSPLFTKISGVHQSSIVIKNSNKALEEQEWLESTSDGSNYADQLSSQEGDGVKRFKFWE